MIYFFLTWIKYYFGLKIPQAFLYTSTRMMLASLTSLLVSIFLGPLFIRKLYEWKIGQPIRTEECPPLAVLHGKKRDTPTMGGILIIFAFSFSAFLWCDLSSAYVMWLFATTCLLGFMGGRDDYLKLKYKNAKGLSGRRKLSVQVLLACLISCWILVPEFQKGVQFGSFFSPPSIKWDNSWIPLSDFGRELFIPFSKEPYTLPLVGMALFFLFVIVGASNGVNLTDGLDGLASGCIVMVASSLAFIAFISNHADVATYLNIPYIETSGEIAIFLSALSGATLGFLWYNGYPAQLFMGDVGSLTLGGVLGVSAVFLKRELLLGIIGAIFVVEALSVILQVASFRLRGQKRIFLCAPLHHHFEYKGWPETKVTLRFWIIGLIFAIIGLLSLKFQ